MFAVHFGYMAEYFTKLNTIVEGVKADEKAAGIENRTTDAKKNGILTKEILQGPKKTCKICQHSRLEEIEALWLQLYPKYPIRQITDRIQRLIDQDINVTNVKGHFGLSRNTNTGELRAPHTRVVIDAATVTKAIQKRGQDMIEAQAKEYSVGDLRLKQRKSAGAWLESISGREHLLDDKVGLMLLKTSIDQDFQEKSLEVKRSQGDKMSAILLGQIGLLGAIFGKPKEQKEIVKGKIVEVQSANPPLPAGGNP